MFKSERGGLGVLGKDKESNHGLIRNQNYDSIWVLLYYNSKHGHRQHRNQMIGQMRYFYSLQSPSEQMCYHG